MTITKKQKIASGIAVGVLAILGSLHFYSTAMVAQQRAVASHLDDALATIVAAQQSDPRAQISLEVITPCEHYITTPISQNRKNNVDDVMRLETFLALQEGEKLSVDGVYGDEDIAAVNRFQEKYRNMILDPLGIDAPTGNVYVGTRKQINMLYCAVMASRNDTEDGKK